MSTYKFSDAITAMWPFPPAVIKASATAAWPFPKSPPEEGTSLNFNSVEARIRELQDEEADNQELDLDGGLSAVNEIEAEEDLPILHQHSHTAAAGVVSDIEAVNATQEARQQGVQFCHVIERNQSFGFNGVTIAYRRCGEWRNSKMVEVAVVYCSQHDNFNKKTGCAWVAEKFLQNNTVVIPARSNKDDDSVVDNLKDLFWYQLADMH